MRGALACVGKRRDGGEEEEGGWRSHGEFFTRAHEPRLVLLTGCGFVGAFLLRSPSCSLQCRRWGSFL